MRASRVVIWCRASGRICATWACSPAIRSRVSARFRLPGRRRARSRWRRASRRRAFLSGRGGRPTARSTAQGKLTNHRPPSRLTVARRMRAVPASSRWSKAPVGSCVRTRPQHTPVTRGKTEAPPPGMPLAGAASQDLGGNPTIVSRHCPWPSAMIPTPQAAWSSCRRPMRPAPPIVPFGPRPPQPAARDGRLCPDRRQLVYGPVVSRILRGIGLQPLCS